MNGDLANNKDCNQPKYSLEIKPNQQNSGELLRNIDR